MTDPTLDSIPVVHIRREGSPGLIPQELWEIKRPPSDIYVQGARSALQLLQKLPTRGLAIVGSRRVQSRSTHIVGEILSSMQGFDWIIVSGLAKGVDAAAHEWALKLGYPTLGILGCGMNVTYPRENHDLRLRILAAGGLILSELPPEHEPQPWTFIHRNRLIAGWTRATWVVQAGFRSGALNTASWAIQNDRTVFSTPSFPGDPTLIGNQKLLNQGLAKCVWGAQSFGEVWLEIESFLSEKFSQSRPSQFRQSLGTQQCPQSMLEAILLAEVTKRTQQEGGITFANLLSWAIENGFTPENFFESAEKLTQNKQWALREGGLIRRLSPI